MPKRAEPKSVDLCGTVDVLHQHLTPALIEGVFREERRNERDRELTLSTMVQFWAAALLDSPPSMSQALREASSGRPSPYPSIGVTPQAFFKRSAELSWELVASVFRAFVDRVSAAEPPRFAAGHRGVASRFTRILLMDGSNLDAVGRNLKVFWNRDGGTPVPGSILACYDLMRGTLLDLRFSPTLREGELTLARQALPGLPKGSLCIADALYGTPQLLSEMNEAGLYGLFRSQGCAHVEKVKCLESTTHEGRRLEDWEVVIGKAKQVRARVITLHDAESVHEVITNVMDPEQLSAREAIALYTDRWAVERVFYDLKEVLNLRNFYCANTNAIAIQVYVSAILHTALRVAQGQIADQASVEPEALSPAKLFPLLAAVSAILVQLQLAFLLTQHANPHVDLNEPDWRAAFPVTSLDQITADKSRGRRPRRKPTRREGWEEMPPPPARGNQAQP